MAVSRHGPDAASASLSNLLAGTSGPVCAIMLANQRRPVGGTSVACVMFCSPLRTWRYDGAGRHWHLGVLPMYMSRPSRLLSRANWALLGDDSAVVARAWHHASCSWHKLVRVRRRAVRYTLVRANVWRGRQAEAADVLFIVESGTGW